MTPDTTPRTKEESALLETAARRLPGGVLGSSRFRDELAFVVKRAQGAHLWDVSGRTYIDYLLGSGPMFLGHAHPAVVKAVAAQLEHGTTYFLVNEAAIALADEICRAVAVYILGAFRGHGGPGEALPARDADSVLPRTAEVDLFRQVRLPEEKVEGARLVQRNVKLPDHEVIEPVGVDITDRRSEGGVSLCR